MCPFYEFFMVSSTQKQSQTKCLILYHIGMLFIFYQALILAALVLGAPENGLAVSPAPVVEKEADELYVSI